MKNIIKIAALSLFLCSCAKDVAPRAIVIPTISPKVESVQVQAKNTSVQSEKTVEIAKLTKEKYKDIPEVAGDISKIEESAKLTTIESKKTEFELEFLKAYAKDVDIKATELAKETEKKDQVIHEQRAEMQKVETKMAVEKQKVSARNGYLAGAIAIIVLLASLILKPWKWFL